MISIQYHPLRKDIWRVSLLDVLRRGVEGDAFWQKYLELDSKKVNVHLGIFVEPYLQYILDGKKTLESRFSINRTAPYNKVYDGDILLLKRSSGPIVGICYINKAFSLRLKCSSINEIRERYELALCIESADFWYRKKDSKYATLMEIKQVTVIKSEINFIKKDRRGWIVLQTNSNQQSINQTSVL